MAERPEKASAARASSPWLTAFWVAAAGAVLVWRCPDLFWRPRLWAEDGTIFFLGAECNGWSAFLDPYAGYFHAIPRAIAWLAMRLDPRFIPAVFAYGSFAVTLLVVARVFSRRLPLRAKPLLALAVVAVPHTGEVYLNPTNVQWITALALILTLLMDDPLRPYERVSDAAVILWVGLTGPFSIFAAPFFFARALVRWTRASWALCGLVAGAAALQAWQVWFHTPPPPPGHPHGPHEWHNLAGVLSALLPLQFFGGQRWAGLVGRDLGIVLGIAALAWLGWVAFAGGERRSPRVTLLLFGTLLTAFTVAKIRADTWPYGVMTAADRYFFIPKVLLLWIVADSAGFRTWRGRGGILFLAAAAVAVGPVFRFVPRPYFAWAPYCDDLRAGREVEVEVSPGWRFKVPPRARGPG